jgi:riboflavin synthase
VGVAPETLRRTNLGALQPGAGVNLERAVSATATRMGGHFVQGHVDTTATIARAAPDGNALTLRLRPRDARVLRYVVEKGYVALDGTSLTVTRVDDAAGWWEVMLVAYTQQKVVLARKAPGDEVNVEVDMLGKYVEKSVQGYLDGLVGGAKEEEKEEEAARDGGLNNFLEKMVRRIVDERLSETRT